MTKVKPGFDYVLCLEQEQVKQSSGGIMLPNGVTQNQVRCKVVMIGPLAEFKGDVTKLSVGSTIIVSQYSGATFTEDNVKYRSVPMKDIIAILEEDE